jgi:hypothetical protein
MFGKKNQSILVQRVTSTLSYIRHIVQNKNNTTICNNPLQLENIKRKKYKHI